MASPSPVPPYLRVVEASTWLKDWNSRSIRSGGMPMPVSRTAKCSDETIRDSWLPWRHAHVVTVTLTTTSPVLGELDRVAQQVDQDLPQPRDVADDGRRDVGGDI